MGIYIGLGTVALLVIYFIAINNQIVVFTNRVDQAFGSIEIYLKKRFDLIPNLVQLLKKYTSYERDILLQVTELRTKANKSTEQSEKVKASNELTGLLSKFNLSVENYPDIKADSQFLELQYQLSDLEDQISASRRAFNANVTAYNNKIEQFPATLVAKIRNDNRKQLLEIPQAEQKNVKIDDLFAS